MTLILRSLAVVVAAGRPDAARVRDPCSLVSDRLGPQEAGSQSSLDASQGIEWTEALYANGLLSASEVGVLASAQRAGNLAWAIRELAETGERRWAYRLQAWAQILFVVVMLVLRRPGAVAGPRLFHSPHHAHHEIGRMIATHLAPASRSGADRIRPHRDGRDRRLDRGRLTATVQVVGWVALERKAVERRERAVLEANNLLERIVADPGTS